MKFNSKIAEFVGIMLGDGYINYPKQPRLKITLNSIVDKEYLQFIDDLIKIIFETKTIIKHRKNENASDIFVFNRKIIRFVTGDLGLIPSPKWKRAKIPGWVFTNKLEKFVLKGYFDTDGCVVIANNNNGLKYPRLEMKISPSPMQKQFITILKAYEFNFGAYDIGKGKIRIQMNGKKELKKWNDLIGFSNPKHQRKCNLFI